MAGSPLAEHPLHHQFLGQIQLTPHQPKESSQSPGWSRQVPAKALVESLAKLSNRRRIRAERVVTGRVSRRALVPCNQPDEMLITVIGPDADDRTNKVDVGMGFELPSFARTEPTGPASQDSSLARTIHFEPNEAESLPSEVEFMSDAEWQGEIDQLGSF